MIPLGPSEGEDADRAVSEYYRSVLGQLQQAHSHGDLPRMQTLLAQQPEGRAPEWARAHLDSYRALATVLSYELRAAEASELSLTTEDPVLGGELSFELRWPPATAPELVLPGKDHEMGVQVLLSVAVIDRDCFGDHTVRQFAQMVRLPETAAVGDGEVAMQPFIVEGLSPEGCLRELRVRAEWLPGTVELGGAKVPNSRCQLVDERFWLYPSGIEAVKANPYTNLRNGLESGEPGHFDHIFLAARLMTDEYREDAVQKLIQVVRVGRQDQLRVVTVALTELVGPAAPVGDRDGWLQWWNRR